MLSGWCCTIPVLIWVVFVPYPKYFVGHVREEGREGQKDIDTERGTEDQGGEERVKQNQRQKGLIMKTF